MGSMEERLAARLAAKRAEDEALKANQAQAENAYYTEFAQNATRGIDSQRKVELARLDSQIAELGSLLSELGSAQEAASQGGKKAIDARKNLASSTQQLERLFTNPEFAALLKEQGVHSLEDLVASSDFAEESEVQDYKKKKDSTKQSRSEFLDLHEKRSAVAAKAQKKVQSRHAVEDAPERVMKVSDITTAVQEIIQDLQIQRGKLYEQTSEGRQEQRQAVVKAMHERHKDQFRTGFVFDQRAVDSAYFVHEADVKAGEVIGEKTAKEELEKTLLELLEQYLSTGRDRKNTQELAEAVKVLDAHAEDLREAARKFSALDREKIFAKQHVIGLLKQDSGGLLRKELRDFYRARSNSDEDLAEAYIYDLSAINARRLDFTTSSQEEGFKRILEEQEARAQNMRQPQHLQFRRSFSSSIHETLESTGLIDPKNISSALEQAVGLYKSVIEKMQTAEDLITSLGSKDYTQGISFATYNSGRSLTTRIELKSRINQLIAERGIEGLKNSLHEAEKNLAESEQPLKEKVKDKIDLEWLKAKLSILQKDTAQRKVYEEGEQIESEKRTAARLFREFQPIKIDLAGNQDLVLQIRTAPATRYTHSTSEIVVPEFEAEQQRLDTSILSLEEQLRGINTEISAVESRAYQEGDGMFGGKKKKREAELQSLRAQKIPLERELQNQQFQRGRMAQRDNIFRDLRDFVHKCTSGSGITLKFSTSPVSTRELLEALGSQLESISSRKLSNEQQRVLATFRQLEAQKDTAQAEYDTKYRSRWR